MKFSSPSHRKTGAIFGPAVNELLLFWGHMRGTTRCTALLDIHYRDKIDFIAGPALVFRMPAGWEGRKDAMRVLIDADGCPVVKIAVEEAKKHGVPCVLVCDTAHSFSLPGVRTVTVSQGADSADFALVNLAGSGDLVVTQDYGLAAMCLARGAIPLNQDGMRYHDGNIDALLDARHMAKKYRRAGGRLKGPSKRSASQDKAFRTALLCLLEEGRVE